MGTQPLEERSVPADKLSKPIPLFSEQEWSCTFQKPLRLVSPERNLLSYGIGQAFRRNHPKVARAAAETGHRAPWDCERAEQRV
jgi:hypothetical protein